MAITMFSKILMFKRNKQGSYLIEASIILPILIISICSLVILIRIISTCEYVTFISSSNMLDALFSPNNKIDLITLCNEVKDNSDYVSSFKVTRYEHLFEDMDDDLIVLDTEAEFKVVNAIGIYGQVSFDLKLMCRGFTGKTHGIRPLDESEFYKNGRLQQVYVFPKYGEKYHIGTCRYLDKDIFKNAYAIKMDREDALRKGYTSCVVCQGAAYE